MLRIFMYLILGLLVYLTLSGCGLRLNHSDSVQSVNGIVSITPDQNTKYIVIREDQLIHSANSNHPPEVRNFVEYYSHHDLYLDLQSVSAKPIYPDVPKADWSCGSPPLAFGSPKWFASNLSDLSINEGVVYSDFSCKDKSPSLFFQPTEVIGAAVQLAAGSSRLISQPSQIQFKSTSYGESFLIMSYHYDPVSYVPKGQDSTSLNSLGTSAPPSILDSSPYLVREIEARQSTVADTTTLKGGIVYVRQLRSTAPSLYISFYPGRAFSIHHSASYSDDGSGTFSGHTRIEGLSDFFTIDFGVIPSTSTFTSTPNPEWKGTVPIIFGGGYDLSGLPILFNPDTTMVLPFEIVAGWSAYDPPNQNRWKLPFFIGASIDGIALYKTLIGGGGGSSAATSGITSH